MPILILSYIFKRTLTPIKQYAKSFIKIIAAVALQFHAKLQHSLIAPEEQYRHENFCEPIIDRRTWDQAQFLLKQRSEINPRSSGGRKLHRYSALIKCAECGSCFIAKNRTWRGEEYVEYTCNSNHRYGKQYCTPHRIHESQLDELVFGEVQNLKEKIVAESEKYDEIVKQWLKQKPASDLQIRQYEEKILALKQQIEDLIMGKVTDKSRAEFYDSMIEKREREIAELQKKYQTAVSTIRCASNGSRY